MTSTFFPIEKPWECPELTEINRLPIRATLYPYPSLTAARKGVRDDSPWVRSLNGQWAFRLFDRPEDVKPEHVGARLPDKSWDRIAVPACWTLQGYDKPHYTNVQMAWENNPPTVMAKTNPTGVYRTRFTLPADWRERRTVIQFGGIESCGIVYLNGRFVGFSKDTRLPAEFDLTPYLKRGSNVLAVICIRYGDATYIEDQDHWWMAGLYRDVFLYSTERVYIEDVFATTTLDPADYRTGRLQVRTKLTFTECPEQVHRVEARLYDGTRSVLAEPLAAEVRPSYHHDYYEACVEARLPDVKAWSAEQPALYTLTVSLKDHRGRAIEHTSTRVGFRTYEVKDRQFLVNGRPVMIRGVCRHDHDPDHGKTVPMESLLADVLTMKRFNVNAVRTSHYPNDPAWYDLCDEYGIYVLDEANIENHANYGTFCHDHRWAKAYFERITRMVIRDKNHACIFGWSLCNESGYGENHDRAADWVRQYDPSRILHNQGSLKRTWIQGENRLEGSGDRANDLIGPMYTHVKEVEQWAKTTREKRPFIMCEYASGTGNAAGGLKEYWDLFQKYHGLQGGFLWQWINHGIRRRLEDGTIMWAYGGDFGDEPNDGNFICNGFVFADRTPKPALFEFKKLAQPIRVEARNKRKGVFRITNLDWFQDAGWLQGSWTIEAEGRVAARGKLPELALAPQASMDVTVPVALPEHGPGEEVFLTFRFAARRQQAWCEAGHEVAWEQFELSGGRASRPVPARSTGTLELRETERRATVAVGDLRVILDKTKGRLAGVRLGGRTLVKRGPEFNLWRGPLDNDAMKARWGSIARSNKIAARWLASGYYDLRSNVTRCECRQEAGHVSMALAHEILPRGKQPGFRHEQEYRVTDAGVLLCEHVFSFGDELMEVPRLGIRMTVPEGFETLTWFGPGPHETYCDRNQARVSRYEGTVEEQAVPYRVPQENGNKDAARWFELRADDGAGLRIQASGTFGFSAHHFTPEDLTKAFHVHEIKRRPDITVLIDARQRGLGTGGCGPDTLDTYRIFPGTYRLAYAMMPLAARS